MNTAKYFRLLVLGLAPSHFLCTQNDTCVITKVQFTKQVEPLQGKKKKGSQSIQPEDVLCEITYKTSENENNVIRFSGFAKGKLLEVNSRLSTEPTMAQLKPMTMGYLAIIDPNTLFKNAQLANKFLTEQGYISLDDFKLKRFNKDKMEL